MPVQDDAAFVLRAIESMRAQTFTDFELIVIDDGSADDTSDVVGGVDDARIRLLRNERPSGIAKSLNVGLAVARGEYIARMDADDWAYDERFSRQVDSLDRRPEIGVLGTQVRRVDPTGSGSSVLQMRLPTLPAHIDWKLHLGNSLGHPTVMMRREIVESVGGYPDSWAEDYELWVLLKDRTRIANLDEVLLDLTVRPTSYSHRLAQPVGKDSLAASARAFRLRLGREVEEATVAVLRQPASAATESVELIRRAGEVLRDLTQSSLAGASPIERRLIERDEARLLLRMAAAGRRRPAVVRALGLGRVRWRYVGVGLANLARDRVADAGAVRREREVLGDPASGTGARDTDR